jgi:hypothetical protein
MAYPPNEQIQNFTVFNGGTSGATVSPGQYALDWVVSLGGSATVDANGTTLRVHMPFQPDNTPTPLPDALEALILNNRLGVIAAVAGKVYPPGSDQPCPLPGSGYYP